MSTPNHPSGSPNGPAGNGGEHGQPHWKVKAKPFGEAKPGKPGKKAKRALAPKSADRERRLEAAREAKRAKRLEREAKRRESRELKRADWTAKAAKLKESREIQRSKKREESRAKRLAKERQKEEARDRKLAQQAERARALAEAKEAARAEKLEAAQTAEMEKARQREMRLAEAEKVVEAKQVEEPEPLMPAELLAPEASPEPPQSLTLRMPQEASTTPPVQLAEKAAVLPFEKAAEEPTENAAVHQDEPAPEESVEASVEQLPEEPEPAEALPSPLEPAPSAEQGTKDLSRTESLVVLLSSQEVEVLAPRARRRSGRRGAVSKPAEAESLKGVQGGVRYVRFGHDMPLGKPLARHLVASLKEHGVAKRPIRLALAADLLPAKMIEVPQLQPKDLHQVVTRRAAAIIEAEASDITFSGIALDGEDVEERRWLVHPVEARPLVALQIELRSLGWPVKEVVPARTAPLLSERARAQAVDGRATIMIAFDHDTTVLGLISQGLLAHFSTIPGGANEFLSGDQMERSLIQELRGIDAFWRRSNRGDQVSDILVLGASEPLVDTLRPAIKLALGNVTVDRALESVGADDAPRSSLAESAIGSRMELLRGMRTPRVSVLDLGLPLPPRARSIVGVGLASLVICASVATGIRHHMEGLASSISTEARVVEARSSDLEDLRSLQARVDQLESRIRSDCKELQQLETIGVSAASLISGLRRAFDDDTRLLSVRALGPLVGGAVGSQSGAKTGVLQIRGVVRDQAGVTSSALDRLTRRLMVIPGVTHVSIEPPSLSDQVTVASFGPGAKSLAFLATAKLTSGALRE